jgi:hypothetical protein
MKLRSISLWVLTFFLMGFVSSMHAQIQMEVTADTNRMMVGDQLKLVFTITCEPSITVNKIVLDSITAVPGFEISEEKDWVERATAMSKILTKEMIFTAFEPGDYAFPEVPYLYSYQGKEKEARSRSWKLTVLPLNTSEEDIAPNKDIVVESFFFERYKTTIFIALGLIALSVLLYYLNKNRKKELPEMKFKMPELPPAEVALKALSSLRESRLWESEDHKVFQTALSGILRQYLSASLKIPALNSTSHEIVTLLKQINMSHNIVDTTDKALNIADLVKFANAQSRNEINYAFIGKVEELVDETESLISNKVQS